VFDASFADDVNSDEEEKRSALDGALQEKLPPDMDADDDQPGAGSSRPEAITPVGSARPSVTAGTLTPTGSSSTYGKASGRPKGGKKSLTPARPTYASPDGRPLTRASTRADIDALEMLRNQKNTTCSNCLGGGDLRVLRDNMVELTGKSPSTGSKRDATDFSSSGATYASNKRVRAKKRLDQMRKELDEAEDKQSAGASDMVQMLVLMREDADRRSETEDRRRREDREARLAADRQEREDRESLRRDEAAAAEARRSRELEIARTIREEQSRKEAALAAENRLRYEERLERDHAEARKRHEQMLLLISAMQRGSNLPK
jgi:hypothetical protein